MTTEHIVPEDLRELYHVREWRNAAGVLSTACPDEWADIVAILRVCPKTNVFDFNKLLNLPPRKGRVFEGSTGISRKGVRPNALKSRPLVSGRTLREFRLLKSEVAIEGGALSPISQRIDGAFRKRGWAPKKFETMITVDKAEYASPTHEVDCFKGRVALELEWNNKDPFFDRDLNNFRLLFDLRAIDVGIILTRASELQTIFKALGKGTSYGNSTTHHNKLWPRLDGGGGGGCPILTFAITPKMYVDDGPEALAAARAAREARRTGGRGRRNIDLDDL